MPSHLTTPPRLHAAGHDAGRKVTWLELFYDLVYVAVLIQLGNVLSEEISWPGVLRFVLLFAPIWWAWTGITFYMNRFVVDDLAHRLLIYMQIVAIAVLGVSVSAAFGALTMQFALAYAAIRLILVLLYLRTWRSAPATKPLTQRYVAGYVIGIGLWVVSAFMPMPWAALLWLAALAVEIGNVFASRTRQLQSLLPPDPHHMRERYGIFVIIVLGESFIKTITSAPGLALTPEILTFSMLGIFAVLAIWWLYFNDVETTHIKPHQWAPYVWIYAHLPLTLGLTAFGVGAKKLFQSVGAEHIKPSYLVLYGSALVLYVLALALIELATTSKEQPARGAASVVRRLVLASALALLFVFGHELNALVLIAGVALLLSGALLADIAPKLRAATVM